MTKIDYLVSNLKDPATTTKGLITLVGVLGVTLDPQMITEIVTVGGTLYGLISIFFDGPKSSKGFTITAEQASGLFYYLNKTTEALHEEAKDRNPYAVNAVRERNKLIEDLKDYLGKGIK